MSIRIVRLGQPREKGEGLRIGTVRRPPRGVKKADFAKRDFYDAWLPDLAPTQELVSFAMHGEWTPARWKTFERKYRGEMRSQARLLAVLAALSHTTSFSVGCYCEDETVCHRSVLRELLREQGAAIH